jgi:hypothetical protein
MLVVGQRGGRPHRVALRRVERRPKPGEHRGDDPITPLAAELERDRQEGVEARAERLLQAVPGPV